MTPFVQRCFAYSAFKTYCFWGSLHDESDSKGKFFSNFYGGVLVSSEHLAEVHNKLLAACRNVHFKDEIKWHKVSAHYLEKYKRVMDVFFQLMKQGKIKVRIMFTQNAFVATHLTDRHRVEEFFILYYQFIKHAFGFGHAEHEEEVFVRMYFDYLPDTVARRQALKNISGVYNRSVSFRKRILRSASRI